MGLKLLIEFSASIKRDPVDRDRLTEIVQNLKDGAVEVGVVTGLGDHPNADGATVAEIAIWNEFGVRRRANTPRRFFVPPRPFLRSTMRLKRLEYRALMRKLIKQILRLKMNRRQAVKILGLQAKSDVQNTIKVLSRPRNRQRTIDKKGSSNPLIDTGFLRQAIDWVEVNSR